MAKRKIEQGFAFYDQLFVFYNENKSIIKKHYTDLTRKFLTYNDWNDKHHKPYLRRPQFEALEIYVFLKEILNNEQVFQIFDDWRKKQGVFTDRATVDGDGNHYLFDSYTGLFDTDIATNTDLLFREMKKYKEEYPNYIFSLAMGLGKTILMATCIFYEFLLAYKYPKDDRFCHNALVFAPDKTVLESLREIMTFDKSKVIPKEYVHVLDENIKFHYLDDSGTTLGTIDNSDFNIIISNTQKIIVKKKRKGDNAVEKLFSTSNLLSSIYGESIDDDESLIGNQRFEKLCRLPHLGVYVDEAHHLFGADLEKQLRAGTANKTSLRDTINMLSNNTRIIACYNFTGTPYVNNQPLPEVVYSYGLHKAIINGFLKQASPEGFENVKSEDFIKQVIKDFNSKYLGKTFEGLNPKLAIFAASIDEAINEVRPAVERVLAEEGIPLNRILINVGDERYTKSEDIYNFNNLDIPKAEGNNKQYIILVGKGKEGWNCRSLFGVALFRSPKSNVFVLQATMRCLRSITDQQQTARVYLSKENWDTLDKELYKNFNMSVSDITNKNNENRQQYQVRVVPPTRRISLKRIRYSFNLLELQYTNPVDFGLANIDYSRYEAAIYEKDSIARASSAVRKRNADEINSKRKFSELTLTAEIAKYLNRSCLLIGRMLKESADGLDLILNTVNKYNEIVYDVLIPTIFNTLYKVEPTRRYIDRDVILLKEPADAAYYIFSADKNLVISADTDDLSEKEKAKTFHADTYCFDSKPEKELFMQYVTNNHVDEVYFTGMFTSNQTDLMVQYFDPESERIRSYYPDFLAKMEDGTYQLIEVKGDNMIDNVVVQAKAEAAKELAEANNIRYIMYAGSEIMSKNVLQDGNN